MKTIVAFVIAGALTFLALSLLGYEQWNEATQGLVAAILFVALYFAAGIALNGGLAQSPAQTLKKTIKAHERDAVRQMGTYYLGIKCPHCDALLTSGVDAQHGWLRTDGFDQVAFKQGVLKCVHCGTPLRVE